MSDVRKFHDYVLSFYGDRADAIYPFKFTQAEVVEATTQYIDGLASPENFCADSIDRERVRDIILESRGVTL
jgi:hypothetical protein